MDQVGEIWAALSGVWWGVPVVLGVCGMAVLRLVALAMGWAWPSGDGAGVWPSDGTDGGGNGGCGD